MASGPRRAQSVSTRASPKNYYDYYVKSNFIYCHTYDQVSASLFSIRSASQNSVAYPPPSPTPALALVSNKNATAHNAATRVQNKCGTSAKVRGRTKMVGPEPPRFKIEAQPQAAEQLPTEQKPRRRQLPPGQKHHAATVPKSTKILITTNGLFLLRRRPTPDFRCSGSDAELRSGAMPHEEENTWERCRLSALSRSCTSLKVAGLKFKSGPSSNLSSEKRQYKIFHLRRWESCPRIRGAPPAHHADPEPKSTSTHLQQTIFKKCEGLSSRMLRLCKRCLRKHLLQVAPRGVNNALGKYIRKKIQKVRRAQLSHASRLLNNSHRKPPPPPSCATKC